MLKMNWLLLTVQLLASNSSKGNIYGQLSQM